VLDSSVLRLTTTEVRDNFAQTVNRVADGQVILSQDGKDVAAIIHIEEFWLLERSIEQLEDEFYAEEAELRLKDPNEVPIPYEFAKPKFGVSMSYN